MSKKFTITESERKNILSYYSIKGILNESYGETITKNVTLSGYFIQFLSTFKSIFLKGYDFWPYLDFKESGNKLVGSFSLAEKEKTKNFLNDLGITEYENKNVEIEKITVEFVKKSNTEDSILEEKTKKFLSYLESGLKSDEDKPYLILCRDLITKGYTSEEKYASGVIAMDVEFNFTSVILKVDSEQSIEDSPEPEPSVNPSQTPDNVGDSGLPEGEFEDEVLSKGKTKKPSWVKRLLTREKTELMNKLKSLKGKFIKVDDMYFEISDIKVSSDLQGVLVFSCRQQRINADLVNKPRFKFFGKKDFYFACRGKADDCIFYDSAQYRYNKNDYIYYGSTIDEIKEEVDSIDQFVFKNICKFINPK